MPNQLVGHCREGVLRESGLLSGGFVWSSGCACSACELLLMAETVEASELSVACVYVVYVLGNLT
jgi:hypothetical protein